jgi:hypothetical protein
METKSHVKHVSTVARVLMLAVLLYSVFYVKCKWKLYTYMQEVQTDTSQERGNLPVLQDIAF